MAILYSLQNHLSPFHIAEVLERAWLCLPRLVTLQSPARFAPQSCCSSLSTGNKFPVLTLVFYINCTVTGGKASMGGFERSGGKGFKCSTLEEQVCLVQGAASLVAEQWGTGVEWKGKGMEEMRGSNWGFSNFSKTLGKFCVFLFSCWCDVCCPY